MADRTLIVAATNTLARGYMLVPTDRRSGAREPVNGLYAVARGIARALAFKLPARAVGVIEANEPPASWPPLLRDQLPRLPAVFDAFGIRTVHAPDELHVVASYAQAALEAGDDVVVVGMDKRLAQLVGDRVWWYDANKDARYTHDMVVKRFGVPPAQVAEWLALVGNPDDGLPGIAGIGAKGATDLLNTHGSVDAALAAIDAIKGRAGNALRAAQGAIPAELRRARLDRDRDLPVPLADLAFARAPAGTRTAGSASCWRPMETSRST
jgi:DNA polymerase-1